MFTVNIGTAFRHNHTDEVMKNDFFWLNPKIQKTQSVWYKDKRVLSEIIGKYNR